MIIEQADVCFFVCNQQKGASYQMDGDPYSNNIPAAERSWLCA